jgi:hypothetical protein
MHSSAMRTHSDIIRAATVPALHDRLGISLHTIRSWAQRDSIPADQWKPLADAGLTSLDELAEAAATRKQQDAA